MNLTTVLSQLAQLQIKLWAEGTQLRVEAPKGAMTPSLRNLLTTHKAELLAWLHANANGTDQQLPQLTPQPTARYQPFPLTPIQHAYWVGRSGALAMGQVSTHGYSEFEFAELDVPRLTAALNKVIARHEMLRAVVLPTGQQQIQAELTPYTIPVLDLRECSEAEQAARLAAIRQALSHQVLPLDHAPLFDIRVTRLADDSFLLHNSIDILMFDIGSLYMILHEWEIFYQNPNARLPSVALSFRDYVVAEEGLKNTAIYAKARDYWHKRIDDLPPAPELPLAKAPSAITEQIFSRRSHHLRAEPWQALKRKAQQLGISPSVLLLTAFSAILKTWCKQPRFTLNLTLFNRLPLHPQVNQLVGDFTSLTLVDVDYRKPITLTDQSKQLYRQLWEALEHRYFTGVDVMREMARRQNDLQAGAMPVVFTSSIGVGEESGKVFFNLHNGHLRYGITQTPQVWLDHQVFEYDGGLLLNWDTVDALFPPALLDDMFAAYQNLLERLVAEEGLWDDAYLSLLPASQASQYAAVNATTAPLSHDLLPTRFLQQMQARPHAPAVIAVDRTLTYQELYEYANTIGHWLRAQAGDTALVNRLVAVVMEKGWEQVATVLGIHLAGGAYLPIDPNLPTERQQYLLRQGEVTLALTQSHLAERLRWPTDVHYLAIDTLVSDPTLPALPLRQQPTDLAYVIYTSGSTGLPKGVIIDHRGAVNTVLDINQRFQVTAQDRVLALSALNFDLSVYDIFGLLAVGGAIVMPSPEGRTDPAHWLALLKRHGVTLWDTVPALMQMLVDYAESDSQPVRNGFHGDSTPANLPQTLRLVMMSGDWIPVTLPERIRKLWPQVVTYSLGGATEASIWSIYYPITTVDPAWPSIPYGKPMVNQTFYVLDPLLNLRPHWVPGDLYIGGIGLALGYWKDEEKSNAKFIHHPRTGERLYKTGDLGRYLPSADGLPNIEFLGREDFQVKIRGHRIELGEIENALLQHPSIKEAVVNAVGDPKGNRQLVAYVVTDEADHIFYDVEACSVTTLTERWQALVQAGEEQACQRPPTAELAAFHAFLTEAEAASLLAICRTLRQLDCFTQIGTRHTPAEIIAMGALQPRYEKLLLQWLAALTTAGFLQADREGGFTALQPLPWQETITRHLPLSTAQTNWAQPLDDYFQRSIEHHLAMLRGEVNPLEIFFPDGDFTIAETIYRFTPLASYYNQLVGALVTARSRQTSDQPLRILEVGAGTGGTTATLLPLLAPERTHYTFTDLSKLFLDQARVRFAAYPFLQFGHLDINQAPQAQGYPSHQFELILAANVLHDARNLHTTLSHLRTLLAPGGLLLILEGTTDSLYQMSTVRFIEGFSHYEDERLERNSPLLPVAHWQQALTANGYAQVAYFPKGEAISECLQMHVLVAQAPAITFTFSAQKVRTYLAQKLPDYMVPAHTVVLSELPLTANGKVNRQALPAFESHTPPTKTVMQPTTPTQSVVAEIWAGILGTEAIDIHENFFDLGGDSLLATKVLAQIRSSTQVTLPLRVLFEKNTISHLAAYIDAQQALQAMRPINRLVMTAEEEEEVAW